ncbi:LacI family DNA-binding transcriptional regulator [Chitinophaga sancti]|uniref:Substrate-binding domain-containing protein n=1 Tax=Chitinophaga sancti TaxID=1004 RepID=A0A1K1PXD0_9BACT|nr:substrate-binding domain-containing protein [Chitinophaga sancti]WQD61594.1 substrate-binding domain-containing protein [Chitinophaga sancti]WQG92849.1 substrate-binding domain-containing protein [Chitinophaga sancti]SFW51502.1 transcriptional regulator, LacI family [Chitinophaga sancti]
MKGISIKDIAQQAGVSPTTVSFVLNGKGKEKRISEQVSKRILKIAGKLKYKPNQLARGLRTGKTKTIGLIVEDIANNFFANVAKVVEDEADKYGYKVLFGSTEDNEEKARGLLEVLRYRQVDGYIITPTLNLDKDIASLQKPVVLMDRYFPNVKDSSYVVVDNYQGAVTAVDHLVAQGYKHIGIITTTSHQIQMQQRLEGFSAGLKKHGLPSGKNVIKRLPFDLDRPGFTQEITKYLQNNRELDAVFFATNYLGICGIESIRSIGLQIGSELGMVSFDDHDIFRLLSPAVTCVAQPVEEIGRTLIRILMEELDETSEGPKQVVLPLELRERESSVLVKKLPKA